MEKIQALFESKPIIKKVGNTFTVEVIKSHSFTIPNNTIHEIVGDLVTLRNALNSTINVDSSDPNFADYSKHKPRVLSLSSSARYLADHMWDMGNPGGADPLMLLENLRKILAGVEEVKKFKHFPKETLDPITKTAPKLKKWIKDCEKALSEEFTKSLFESQELLEATENEFLEAFGDKKGDAALRHLKAKKYKFGDFHVVNTRTWEDDEGKTVVSLLVQRNEEEPFDILIEE